MGKVSPRLEDYQKWFRRITSRHQSGSDRELSDVIGYCGRCNSALTLIRGRLTKVASDEIGLGNCSRSLRYEAATPWESETLG
jgi:hypothetical protein